MEDKLQVPETVLARIWEEQRFFPDCLYTATGLPVQVIRPGRHNHDAGPDFKQALIRISDHVFEGDVELHLHLRDWQAHGHHQDAHYNQTILHVVLWPPERPTITATTLHKANGESLPTVFVHHVLSESLPLLIELFQEKDHHQKQKRGDCQAHLNDLSEEKLLTRLAQLGEQRLCSRSQRFDEDFLGQRHASQKDENAFEQALYEALCEGFGYAANKQPFRELAQRLPLHTIISHLPQVQSDRPSDHLPWIQAMLFGVAGLIGEKNDYGSETEHYVEQLHSFWEMLKSSLDTTPMPSEAWQFFRLRPANFPTRRIAALSHLVLNYTVQPVFAHYLELFSFYASHPGQEAKQIRLFEHTLELPITGYWQSRYRFGPPAKSAHDKRFLGTSRIRDILISAVFPAYLCYARHTGHTELESQILQLYRRFPSPSWDQGTKTLSAQLFAGQDIPARKLKTATIYQGLLHLAKTSCALPTCSDCLLVHTEDGDDI